jgi:DNA mismatch endonuclease (patch repair protein)
MRGVRQRATKPEQIVRAFLRQKGVAYRCNHRGLPGSPDLANKSKGWAVFVHGCFWHGHEGCSRATVPKRNHTFWLEKICANQIRDLNKEKALRASGMTVAVVWECQALEMAKSSNRRTPKVLVNLLRRLKRQSE